MEGKQKSMKEKQKKHERKIINKIGI